ncbi:MAG: DUF2953 domain-containing protein [Oscillospiraceae bacterium]|nr:DUF2953 domain-containing protein [Oscillospiraceae bacterium]
MVWLWILGAVALLLLALALLPLGVRASYDGELRLALRIGPVERVLIPAPEKTKPTAEAAKQDEKKEKKKKEVHISARQIRQGLPTLWAALKKALHRTRRRLRLYPVELSVTFGGEDPASVAQTYGWAETAMWTVMPQLERLTRMPDPHVHLGVDYNAAATVFSGRAGATLRLGDLVVIVLTFGIPALRWYLSVTKENAAKEQEPAPQAPHREGE